MKNLIILFLFFTPLIVAQNFNVRGKILDSQTNQPLIGANIYLKSDPNLGTATNKNGNFEINNLTKPETLVISYLGYETKNIPVETDTTVTIRLEQKLIPAQTVFVEGSIGKEGTTPLTFNKINRVQIKKNYSVQDIPEFLSSVPSLTYYSEGGNGIGYNYLSIRGFDQRRISVSVNGIPQNDPEDHNVYWLDFPDILSSTDAIQVQRGAGSGVIGAPAIGGSINIITSAFSSEPQFNLESSYGTYNTKKFLISYSSGLVDNKYSFYAKLSKIQSSGYRNNSWTNFNSYYFSGVRYDKNLTTQIDLYGGPIADGLAYTGLPKFAVTQEKYRKLNYSYWEANGDSFTTSITRRPEEKENYSQPHYELLNELRISDNIKLNSALFLVLGDGFFDYDGSWADTSYLRLTHQYGFNPTSNPGNVLIRAQVNNTQYGWVPRLSWKHTSGELIIGGELSRHRSTHWASVEYGENLPVGLTPSYRFNYYNGSKDVIIGYAHESYDVSSQINLLGEVQLAYHKYRLYNERFVYNDFSVSNLFFNPRVGINYKFNKQSNIYFSFARVSTEPRLSDYYNADESSGGAEPEFAKNPNGTFNFNDPLVHPETMNDFELGLGYDSKSFTTKLNFYYMLFNNEIVNNGKVDQYGQPIISNMDETIHKGIELSIRGSVFEPLDIYANSTLSQNTIQSGRYYIQGSEYLDLSGNEIGGFPQFMANLGFDFNYSGLYFKFNGKYVGAFYSDNFYKNLKSYLNKYPGFVSYSDNKNEPYFDANMLVSYSFKLPNSLTQSKVFFQINNIFDRLYSAYAIGQEFFPAAERNFLAGIQVGL